MRKLNLVTFKVTSIFEKSQILSTYALWALINGPDSTLKTSMRNLFDCVLTIFTSGSRLPTLICWKKGEFYQSFSIHWPLPCSPNPLPFIHPQNTL